jgi:two-component system, response regulator / RNA-binding antiterminator
LSDVKKVPPRPATGAPPSNFQLRVLLIGDGARHVDLIRDELKRQGHEVVGVVNSATLIHDIVLRLKPDVVIVDSESPTRDTLENLAVLSSTSPRPVVVFSQDAAQDTMRRALNAGVSAYVIDGLKPERLTPVLQVAIARFEQDNALRAQLAQAQNQVSDSKLVERAKGLLMQSGGMNEDQAHKHLRRLAMDRGMRLADIAKQVIDAHGLLHPKG